MLLNAHGASRLLKTTERQIYRWADDGEIPCRRVRDQLRFNRLELLEWATSRRMPVSVEEFDAADENDDTHATSLARALEAGGVVADVPGTDRDTVLREIVARIALPERVDRELLTDVLLAREHCGTTAVGDGIAIPHVRNPVIAAGERARATVCYLTVPTDFGAADDQPVQCVIMLATPTIAAHLQILARLASALTDTRFKAALARRASLHDLIREAGRIEADAEAPR